MPHIKPRHLNSQQGTGYHASFDGVAAEAISQNDIVIACARDGERVKWQQADADVAGRHLGVLGIADHAASSGGRLRVVSHKVITSVDTSGSTAAGYPVYLSDTAGGWSVSAGSASMVVGNVLEDSATGSILLAPAHAVGIE